MKAESPRPSSDVIGGRNEERVWREALVLHREDEGRVFKKGPFMREMERGMRREN